jgi:DNA-binding SARP family transcriptional activator
MIGGFTLLAGDDTVELPPMVARVVAYVALQARPAARTNVAGMLWLDTPEERAMANLRSALWRLRRPGLTVIQTAGDHLGIAAGVDVDLHDVSATARQLLRGGTPPDGDGVDRLANSGELLRDWYDDWVLVEREHFRQLRLQALEQLAADFAARGQFGRAAEAALAAVATEPLRESAHRALISVHLAQGNLAEAIRQYEIYRRLMRDDLDLEPSQQMNELIGAVKRSHARASDVA